MSRHNKMHAIDPNDWGFVKERGAIARSGGVYRSRDGAHYLRTGESGTIREEAEFAEAVWQRGFPVPEVTDVGLFSGGRGYFVETSAGETDFATLFRQEYAAMGEIGETLFEAFTNITLRFLAAQLEPVNRQVGPSQLRAGIQLSNVLSENPEIPADLMERAVAAVETRTSGLPLVLTHGDFTPFNIMERGVIDFELRMIAPVGYDTITCLTFQRFWDHPQPGGTGTMRGWDFSRRQIASYLTQADTLCERHDVPRLSSFFDDFLMLKAIWALCYERPDDENGSQGDRWRWRKRVALHCIHRYLSGQPIESESFRDIGLSATSEESSDLKAHPKEDQ